MSDTVSRCLVFCRLRPTNAKDFEDGGYQVVSFANKRVAVKDERHYDFDGTFGQDSRQEDVFETIAMPCLNHAVNGFCSALMCYGQTGTGKSFTMCCTKAGLEGIIPRSAKYLFELIARDKSKIYTVKGQFIQIYRDNLGDLMVEGGREKVDIHFEKDAGVTLTGCTQQTLQSAEQFMTFYETGNARRVVTATAMNPESSRGHSAMIIVVESRAANDETAPTTKGKITFIDLAGYERFSKTGISNANPIMKDEAKTINASLLSLGHVVSALSNGDKHVPWRNAKLTRLLQDSIGGRSRTSIILTIGPSSESLHETTNSLQFGQRAMAVKVSAKVNAITDYEKLAAKLQSMLDERDERINLLELQIRSRDAERTEISERHNRDEEELRERFRQEIEELKQKGGSVEQIRKAEEVFQIEVENLKEQQLEEFQYQEEAHNKQIVSLAAEQERRERKKHIELQVAQERIIAEFERKLSSSGGNDDLVVALRQLSEKDSLLASRAAYIADLQERIMTLSTLLEQAGVVSPSFPPIEETFIDLSQLQEIQERLEAEIEYHKGANVSLRSQLEATNEKLEVRATEVMKLAGENERLTQMLNEAGIEGDAGSPLLPRRGFVDVEQLESLRMLMQEDIDRLTSENKSLSEELQRVQLLSTISNENPITLPETPRIGRARAMSRVEGARLVMKRNESSDADREKKVLAEKVSDLERRLVSLTREYNLAINENDFLRDLCDKNDIEVLQDVAIEKNAGAAVLEELLSAKESEIQALLKVTKKQEEALMTESQSRSSQEEFIGQLKQTLEKSNLPIPASQYQPIVVDSSRENIETLMEFINEARGTSTKLLRLVTNKEEDMFGYKEALEAKDAMLQLRENVILEKEATNAALASFVFNIKRKCEEKGILIELPDNLKSIMASAEDMHTNAISQATQKMHDDLRRQQEEKEKLQSVLQTMAAERSREAQLIATAKQEIEKRNAASSALEIDLSQQREAFKTASADTQSLMGIVVELKQQLIDKDLELKKLTHELMRLQAEKGAQDQESIFSLMKRKLRD